MSATQPTHTDRIVLSESIIDEIADKVAAREEPSADDVHDLAHDHVERRTEFVTEDGEQLADAVRDTVAKE